MVVGHGRADRSVFFEKKDVSWRYSGKASPLEDKERISCL
jgi:hypothetical protein